MIDSKVEKDKTAVKEMVTASSSSFQTSLQLKIVEFEKVIDELKLKLNNSSVPRSGRIKVITGIEKVSRDGVEALEPIRSEPMVSEAVVTSLAAGEEERPADPWTTISFSTSSTKSQESKSVDTAELSVHARAGFQLFSGDVSTNISAARE